MRDFGSKCVREGGHAQSSHVVRQCNSFLLPSRARGQDDPRDFVAVVLVGIPRWGLGVTHDPVSIDTHAAVGAGWYWRIRHEYIYADFFWYLKPFGGNSDDAK